MTDKGITDTTKLKSADLFLDSAVHGSDHIIRKLEKQGTKELSESDCLPTIGLNPHWAQTFGIKIVSEVKDDPLFTMVELPKGWQIKTTNHNYWCELFDDKDRMRAVIFYKAAPYDRRAQMHALRRFTIDVADDKLGYIGRVKDGEKIIWVGEPKQGYITAEDDSIHWLEENYPEYHSVYKYWD